MNQHTKIPLTYRERQIRYCIDILLLFVLRVKGQINVTLVPDTRLIYELSFYIALTYIERQTSFESEELRLVAEDNIHTKTTFFPLSKGRNNYKDITQCINIKPFWFK